MELLYTSAISPSLGLLEPGIHGELNLSLRPGSVWLLLPLDLLLVEVVLVLLLARLLQLLTGLLGVEDPVAIVPDVSMVDNVINRYYSRACTVSPF